MAEQSSIIQYQENKEIVPLTNAGRLVRRTILDLTANEVERLQLMAGMYASSGYNKTKQTEGDFFLVMLKGLELGITPMASIDTINIIMGKPVLDAKGMLALVKSSGLLENIHIDASDTICKVLIKRIGNVEQEVSFSLEDAVKMGLKSKDGYIKQPKTMLKWRAVTAAIREVFPDVISGLYTPEELDTDNTVVHEDGTMDLQIPQLPAKKQESPDIAQFLNDNTLTEDTKKWVEALMNIVHSMYKNEFHLNNGVEAALQNAEISTTMSLDKAAAALFIHRCKSEWGFSEKELPELVKRALGCTMKEYFEEHPRDYAGLWQAMKDLVASLQNGEGNIGKYEGEMPM